MLAISQTLLIAALDFAPQLQAQRVAEAIAKGLCGGGTPQPDLLPLTGDDVPLDFDARMKAARALVIATPRLDEHTLLGSLTFELATRARQSGVPAYAITAEDAIDRFDARILDLQVVLEASTTRTLAGAGCKLAALV